MVRPAARRQHPVRREPAEEVPGRLPVRLRVQELARALGRAARRVPLLDRAGREGLPRRQPAHQGPPFLGVGARGDQGAPPRRRLPRGGVHAAEADVRAREGRLLAVVHVLHVAEHEGRIRELPRRAHRAARSPTSTGRASGRTRRTSCPSISSTAGRRRSSRGSCSPRRSRATGASTGRRSS